MKAGSVTQQQQLSLVVGFLPLFACLLLLYLPVHPVVQVGLLMCHCALTQRLSVFGHLTKQRLCAPGSWAQRKSHWFVAVHMFVRAALFAPLHKVDRPLFTGWAFHVLVFSGPWSQLIAYGQVVTVLLHGLCCIRIHSIMWRWAEAGAVGGVANLPALTAGKGGCVAARSRDALQGLRSSQLQCIKSGQLP